MLHIHLTVKFRAGGITFGSMKREWSFDLGVYSKALFEAKWPEATLLNFSERGVTLIVGTLPRW